MTLFAAPQAAPQAKQALTADTLVFLEVYATAEKLDKHRLFNKVISEFFNIQFNVKGIEALTGYKWYDFKSNHFDTFFNERINEENFDALMMAFIKRLDNESKETLLKFLVDTYDLHFETIQAGAATAPKQIAPAAPAATEPKTETKTETTMQTQTAPAAPAAQPTVNSAAEQVNANFTLQLDLLNIVQQGVNQQMAPALDRLIKQYDEKFDAAVQAEAAKRNPTVYQINGGTLNTVKGKTHAKFNKIVRKMAIRGVAYLKGPSGSGKSFMASQIAEALGVPVYKMQVTAGITENHFFGRMLPNGEFKTTPFLTAYEQGGLILIDECDGGDSNAFLAVNDALTNGFATVINRTENPIAKMHENFYCLAAANTWGSGIDGNFAGREIQDEAFLKRFEGAFFELDYDTELEEELLKDAPALLEALNAYRYNLKCYNLNRTLATRDYCNALKEFAAGATIEEILEDYTARYTNYEREKALDGLI